MPAKLSTIFLISSDLASIYIFKQTSKEESQIHLYTLWGQVEHFRPPPQKNNADQMLSLVSLCC